MGHGSPREASLVANLLREKRYIENLGDSLINEEKTDSIIKETTKVL